MVAIRTMAGSIRMRHAIPAHTPNIQPVSSLMARLIVRLAELFLISVHLFEQGSESVGVSN